MASPSGPPLVDRLKQHIEDIAREGFTGGLFPECLDTIESLQAEVEELRRKVQFWEGPSRD